MSVLRLLASIMSFSTSGYGTLCVAIWIYQEWTFYASRNAHKTLTAAANTWVRQFYTGMKHRKLDQSDKVCQLKESALFFLYLVL